jgi:three-Cys-motif partner protein
MPPKTVTWPLEPHTAAKHEILRRYLGAWYPKLANQGFHGRLVFLDGFCGPGIYKGSEKGSPIIALETLVDHAAFSKWSKTEFLFVFFDDDSRRVDRLDEVLVDFWAARGGQPKNVNVITEHQDFASGAESILASLGDKKLAPTFAFIDPFGVKGVPMQLIAQLLAFDRCEVFFNFIYETGVCRWLDELPQHMDDLFGTPDWSAASGLSGEARKTHLMELYRAQLGSVAKFKYRQAFEMVNSRGRTAYYLIYGTRSIDGLKAMKYAMWKVDPSGGVRFSDRLAGQNVLFEEDHLVAGPLRTAIVEEFAGQTVTVDAVEHFVLAETPYRETHYKKRVLKPLEDEGKLMSPTVGRKRGTYPPGTKLTFS